MKKFFYGEVMTLSNYNRVTKTNESEKIKDEILLYKGLCLGGCKRRVDDEASLMTMIDNSNGKEVSYYYLLCVNCLNAMNGRHKKVLIGKIEKNIKRNSPAYASIIYDGEDGAYTDDSGLFSDFSKRMVFNKLNLNSPWIRDDMNYFKKNPNSLFRYRKLYKGEIEDIETLKNDAKDYEKHVRYVIVHRVSSEQRIKAFIGGNIDEAKLMDEYYINALFIGMALNLDDEKINEVYQNLLVRNEVWKDFGKFKFNYE